MGVGKMGYDIMLWDFSIDGGYIQMAGGSVQPRRLISKYSLRRQK
jgi:hypothetical protein